MLKNEKHLVLFIILFISNFYYSQDDGITNVTPEIASNKMKVGNYEDALTDYLQLLNDDSKTNYTIIM